MAEKSVPFPPVVYVPTAPPDEAGETRLELAQLADGRIALFTYSAMDRLAEFYRADASWVLLTVADLQRLREESPYDLIYLDRRPQPATGSDGHRKAPTS